jgi:hypothetical protein
MWTLSQVSQAVKNQTWTGNFPPSVVEYLVVAGGGSGGGAILTSTGSGGGGGGGFLAGHVGITAGSSYTVTVGAGGVGSSTVQGTSGANSVFGSITSTGGGAGGNQRPSGTTEVTGLSGGSGGGGSSTGSLDPGPGGSGINGQGNAGGTGTYTSSAYGGGGGGGAGTVGSNGTSTVGGNGGGGIASSISGTVTAYAGGGGAGTYTSGTLGVGGVGGGGNAARGGTSGSGTVNTGGGGGGNGGTGTPTAGGNGGSGIVIIRYPGTTQFFTGGTLSYANGYIVHTFYANGTLAPTTPTLYANPDYQISRSLRFNSADSAYLSRTPASATNSKTFTWSGWVKRSALPAAGVPIFSTQGSPYSQYLCFGGTDMTALTTDALCFFSPVSGSAFSVQSASVYRDVSAWYHIVCAVDTTQTISANRVRLYVNGSEVSYGSSTYPSQNLDTYINSTGLTSIGYTAATYFRGYITDVNFIDGQALTPSSFGWTNPTTGVWAPLDFVGTYGTNGFNLNFSDNTNTTAGTLGADSSGNGNNFTPSGFSVSAGVGNDSLVDTPTLYGTDTGLGGEVRGNYATFNPLIKVVSQPTLSNGNLLSTAPAGWSSAVGTIGVTSGKWYWEIVNGNSDAFVGICGDNATLGTDAPQSSTGTILYYGNTGNKRIDTVDTGYGSTFSTQTIGVALDIDGGTIVFYRDNVSQGSISLSSSTLNGRTIFPLSGVISTTATVNFGQRPFAYTAPSGFKALCTQNLPTPTIGATSATLASEFFDATTWAANGDNVNPRLITSNVDLANGGGLIWAKGRDVAVSHFLVDSVRGYTKYSATNSTAAEDTYNFGIAGTTNGFTFTTSSSSLNQLPYNYVGWQWKAGGTPVTNTSGSITSSVSANPTSGFSIVTWTGNGSDVSIGHGLGVVPSMVIHKFRGAISNWSVYTSTTGAGKRLKLNTNDAVATDGSFPTTPTSSVFYINGGSNDNGVTMVAYCFAPVAGYSAIGSYTGNGTTDGPFVHTGFKPAFILIQKTTGGYWLILDVARNTYNAMTGQLWPNGNDAENNSYGVLDAVSNGFKLRNTAAGYNDGTAVYIYMAFASNPFKYSLAR